MLFPFRVKRGQRIKADDINTVGKQIQLTAPVTGPGLQSNRSPAGNVISARAPVYNPTGQTAGGFFARITGSTPDGDTRWKYNWQQVTRGEIGWDVVDGGSSGSAAINLAETPAVTYRYIPQKVGRIVRMLATGSGDGLTYTFEAATNGDLTVDAPAVEIPKPTHGTGTGDQTSWGVVANKGQGFEMWAFVGPFYTLSTGVLQGRLRKVKVDPGGRTFAVEGESAGNVIVTFVDCP